MAPALSVRDLRKNIGEKTILNGVSFDLQKGKVTALLGPSGSGKTSLLRCLSGLDSIDSGSIVPKRHDHIGFVFQEFNLWPHKTVLENLIEAPMIVNGIPRSAAEQKAKEHLREVELEEKIEAYPSQLSGGQQQRIAIARALMMKPDVLLLDEITSALDHKTAAGIMGLIHALAKGGDKAILLVTHDLPLARTFADTAFFMDKGVIVKQGAPENILDQR